MKLFRKISDSAKWASYEEHRAWKEDDCPGEMLNELYDSRGISVWDVGAGDRDEVLRLCAVLGFGMASVREQYSGIVFDADLVRKSGMKLTETPGKELCARINKSHRDITSVTTKRFAAWAKAVIETGEVIVFTRSEILDRMAKLHSDGELMDVVPKMHGELLPFLWKQKRILLKSSAVNS